jgi:hypothetical protein
MMARRVRMLVAAVAIAASVAVGVSLSRADAPPGRYTVTSSSVFDTVTGLTWERVPANTTYTIGEARTYCTDLYTPDSSNWRMPSMKELQTLVDETRANPMIDLTAFPGAPSATVWSGTARRRYPGEVWAVSFTTGETTSLTTNRAYVRCVR